MVKTEKFKVKINNPWIPKGTTLHRDYIINNYIKINSTPEDFPEIFEPVYSTDDNYEVCKGDLVWRVKNNNITQVAFNTRHIINKTAIFGKRENIENWLEKNAKNIKLELLKQNNKSSFQTLKSLIKKFDDISDLTHSEISMIANSMKNCVNTIENNINEC